MVLGRLVSIIRVPSKPVLLFCCQLMSRNVGPSFMAYYSVVLTCYDIRLITLVTLVTICSWSDLKTMMLLG